MNYTNIDKSNLSTLPGLCCCPQHTIPLLMDDCLSMLQKICALWSKLNELITNYNQFLDDFSSWKNEVENVLTDLQSQITALESRVSTLESKVSTLESDVSTIKTDISNIKTGISNIENDIASITRSITSINVSISNIYLNISDIKSRLTKAETNISTLTDAVNKLESRIDELEDLLNHLNVKPPVEIMNSNAFTNVLSNWFTWFQANFFGGASALSDLGWTTTTKLFYWDSETPKTTLSVGVVGQNIVLAKMPFICCKKAAIAAQQNTPTTNDVKTSLASEISLLDFYSLSPSNGFFDVELSTSIDFQPDEMKFATSYIPFLPKGSRIFRLVSMTNTLTYLYDAKYVNNNVRLQVTKGSTTAKMCVVPQDLYVAVCPDTDFGDIAPTEACTWSLYIYCIAENF